MQQYSFFLWAAAILLGVVLAGFAPKKRTSLSSLGLASLGSLGFLFHLGSGWLVLASFSLATLSLLYFMVREPTSARPGPTTNPPEILLHWIILGSLLLVLAMVLKGALWRPLVPEEAPNAARIWSGYGFLLIPIAFALVTWTLVRHSGSNRA